MTGQTRILSVLAALALAFSLTACSPSFRNHGYMPPAQDLEMITVGVDTRETVLTTIGAPGTSGLLTTSNWFYVRSKFRHYTYNAPEEIDREVVAISFDADGVVENIERFGLEDGRVVALERRVTEQNVKGVTFLRQLFKSFGRIDTSQLIGG